MRHKLRRLLRRAYIWLVWTSPVWASPCAALADEPCHAVPNGVLCTTEGFDSLMAGVIDLDRDGQVCGARLKACNAAEAELQKRLDFAIAHPCPKPLPPPPEPKALAPALGMALAFTGILATTAAPFLPNDTPAGLKLSLGLGGAIATGLGVALALP